MNERVKKWGIIGKSLGITGVLVIFRLIFDFAQLDIIALTTLLTAFIGGAIFTVAIIFTGTLADFKESEKIPGDLASSLLTVFQDSRLLRPADNPFALRLQEGIRRLHGQIVSNFRANTYGNREIRETIAGMNEAIYELADRNAPPQYLVKLRAELASIDRTMQRVRTISETSFIPAAYAIAELAVAGVVLLLFFVKLDPFYEGLIMFTVLVSLLVSILLLIRDMDNPFEYNRKSFADVDFTPLFELGEHLGGSPPP
jgi:hypothetical protein